MIKKAYDFAKEAHSGQYRKYTKEDYIVHPKSVALLTLEAEYWSENMFIGAILHDVVEDNAYIGIGDIKKKFGKEISRIVWGLTDQDKKEDGKRDKRKEINRNWNAQGCYIIQTIKLCDLIDNSISIIKYDEDFARVYMREKNLLLDILTKGDRILFEMAQTIIDDYYFKTKVDKII